MNACGSLLATWLLLSLAGPVGAGTPEGSIRPGVPIPGGTFTMGTSARDVPALRAHYAIDFPGVFENETPAHAVTLGDFRMDPHEVTYARFDEFLRADPRWRDSHVVTNAIGFVGFRCAYPVPVNGGTR